MIRQVPGSMPNQKPRRKQTNSSDFPALKPQNQQNGADFNQSSSNNGGGMKPFAPQNRQSSNRKFQYGSSRSAHVMSPHAQENWPNDSGPNWQHDSGLNWQSNPGPNWQYTPEPNWQNNPGSNWQNNPGPRWQSHSGQNWNNSSGPSWQDDSMSMAHRQSNPGPPLLSSGGARWRNDPGPWHDGQEPNRMNDPGPYWQDNTGPGRVQPAQHRGVVRINNFSSNNSAPAQRGMKTTGGSNASLTGGSSLQTSKPAAAGSSGGSEGLSDAKLQPPRKGSKPQKNITDKSQSAEKAKNQTGALRVLTSTIHGAKKWNRSKNMLGLTLFEVYGIVDSATLKDSSLTGKEFTLRDEGSSLPCIFYEIDRQLPRLVRGQWYRCVGKFKPSEERFQCFSIRPTTTAERKMASVSMRQVETYLLKFLREP